MKQRYVSKELTHFVGRKLNGDKQRYDLFKKIVSDGFLSHPPHQRNQSGGLIILADLSFCDRKMYDLECVCFCDIPVADYKIHMKKYSRFGLSFLKSFLIKKGATPLFYIASNSVKYAENNYDLWNDMIKTYHDLVKKNIKYPEDPIETQKVRRFQQFLDFNVFGYVMPFDTSLKDNHPDNYYMEREWRIIGNLDFNQQDIYRVVLPRSYVKKFKRDFPDYCGQITFSD